MWIGTYGGLCRFDGEQMEVFDTVTGPGLRGNRITCLHESADGTLWLGSDQSGLASYSAGRFQPCPEVSASAIQTLASDADGHLLVGTPKTLLIQEGASLRALHPERLQNVRRILLRSSGELLAAADGGVWRFDGGGAALLAGCNAQCLAEFEGRVLVGTERGLYRLDEDGLAPWEPLAWLQTSVHALLPARDGALWIGTALGAVRLDPRALSAAAVGTLDREAGQARPAPQAARVLCEDREGGIWIGHSESGLARLRAAEVRSYRGESGLPPRGIVAVLGDGAGELYVGTSQGLLHGRPGRLEPVPGAAEFGSCRGMALDPDGTLWFSTRQGLARLQGEKVELWHDFRVAEQRDARHPARPAGRPLAGRRRRTCAPRRA